MTEEAATTNSAAETAEETETAETAEEPTLEGAKPSGHERLPDDHPVVLALSKANEEAKQARLKVKEYEDASKSEQEKLTERASELEKNLTTAQRDAARYEIAIEKGLTKSQAKRLNGETREELEADADVLLEDLGLSGDEGESGETTSRRPKERLKPGASPDAEPGSDPEKIADRILNKNRF